MELTHTLKTFIEEGQDWEQKHIGKRCFHHQTSCNEEQEFASLAIDINPIGEHGLPMKKKGIMIMNAAGSCGIQSDFR